MPWFVVNAEDKKEAHLGLITHLLNQLKYDNKNEKLLSHKNERVFLVSTETLKEKLY